MRRIEEKVKDIVEVCPFTHLHDFAADLSLTLSGYHFTDITADLMAKWIDRIAAVKPGQGVASALAGFRGVGKSHFLATLGAIVARPELRPRISDQHVESTADRLSRRHGRVALVRRGTGVSLIDELKRAVGEMLAVNPATLKDSLYDLLLRISEHAGELPLVLLIDTEMGRDSRVTRDDGAVLSEIAEAAKTLGIFVGVALDDDISGADGANSSIAGNFVIDYLDQEHLYKIVDTYIFSKHSQMRPVLHDIYGYYREVLPGFRWSEQRFSSLYPLHPATVEIAPLIRLYIQDFALLGFASEAGVKILGRPANSLIGLDEIFDSVEARLRAVAVLKDAFAAFDKLQSKVVTPLPVHSRLPAKLILKGLLLLSFNGQGVTASELAATMMVFTEASTGILPLDIPSLLDSFAEHLPKSIARVENEKGDVKYTFKFSEIDDFDEILAEKSKQISDDDIWHYLLRQTAEKFADITLTNELGDTPTPCNVEWRGAMHRGQVVWMPEVGNLKETADLDWILLIANSIGVRRSVKANGSLSQFIWRLAILTDEERQSIARLCLINSDDDIRESLGERLSTELQKSSIAVDRIWQRVFITDSVIIAGDGEYRFPPDANTANGLSNLLGAVFGEVFESHFSDHPNFSETFTPKLASALISNFFSGSSPNSAEAQKLAEIYAVPLGLAEKKGDEFAVVQLEALLELPSIKTAFESSATDENGVFLIGEILSHLRAEPYGLTREAQRLILAALVAQRQYEFVTLNGNRINHRSLDLQIVWDDIVGLAKPLNELYAPARLLAWAKLISANNGLKSLDKSEDRLLILDSLSGWLKQWRENHILDDFNELPDENLSAAIWRTAANLRKTFGGMAGTIELLINDDINLDQCFHSIADLFSDSEDEFESKRADLELVRGFTSGVTRRSETANYLTLCETTGDDEIDSLRQALLHLISSGCTGLSEKGENEKFEGLWKNFKEAYIENYVVQHNAVMESSISSDALRDVLRSDDWSAFECFSRISSFNSNHLQAATALIRKIRQMHCTGSARELLNVKPLCGCAFSLSESAKLLALPARLKKQVRAGLEVYWAFFQANADRLASDAESAAMGASIAQILHGVETIEDLTALSSQDIRILRMSAERFTDLDSDTFETSAPISDPPNPVPEEMGNWEPAIEQTEIFASS